MGKPTGFLEYARQGNPCQPPLERVAYWNEFHPRLGREERQRQGARCMACGVPFCQSGAVLNGMVSGCPLHNLVPEWNDLVYRRKLGRALERLLKTNDFPEFTGRVCPALCEAACTCGLNGQPVTVKDNELGIIEEAWEQGLMSPRPPETRTGRTVAVVGSGPAGLSCAQRLNRRGHSVTVFERADRPGGLLMYGIPNMKLEKSVVWRRTKLMEELGIEFRLKTDAADPAVAGKLLDEFDAVVIAAGSRAARGITAQGAQGQGVVYAVDYLTDATCSLLENAVPRISAEDLDVVVIGGGDTGNDCVGTAVRQGARSVAQLEFLPKPPASPRPGDAWPEWPCALKTDYGQQEAIDLMDGEMRLWGVDTIEIARDESGAATGVVVVDLDWSAGKPRRLEGTERTLPAQLVLIACGFTGPEASTFDAFGALVSDRGRPLPVMEGASHRCTPKTQGAPGAAVFACGDARTGSSLVVNAIADALACAGEVARELAL